MSSLQSFLESDTGAASLDLLVEELEADVQKSSWWSRAKSSAKYVVPPLTSLVIAGVVGVQSRGLVHARDTVQETAMVLWPWYAMCGIEVVRYALETIPSKVSRVHDYVWGAKQWAIRMNDEFANVFGSLCALGIVQGGCYAALGWAMGGIMNSAFSLRELFFTGLLTGSAVNALNGWQGLSLAHDALRLSKRRERDVHSLVRSVRGADVARLDTYASVHGPEVNACAAQLNEKGRLVGKLYVNEDDESTLWRMKRSSGGNTVKHLSHVVSALHELTREECTLGITVSLDQASYENLCDAVFDHVTEVAVEGVRDGDVLFTVKYVRHKVGSGAEVRVYDADMMRVVPAVYKAIFDRDAQVRDVPSSLWRQVVNAGELVSEETAEIEELQEESEELDAGEEEIAEFKDLCGLPEPVTCSDRVIALFEKFRDKINWDDEMPSITILSGSVAYVLRPGKERRGVLLRGQYERMYDVILAAQVEGIDGSSVFELAKELHDEGKGVMPGVVVDVLLEAVDYNGFFTLRQRPQSIAEHCFFAELCDKTNCEVEISLPDEGVSYAGLLSGGHIASTPIATPDFSGHVILGEAYAEKVLVASNVRVMANTNKWVLLREGLVRVDTVFSAVKNVAEVSSGSASITLG